MPCLGSATARHSGRFGAVSADSGLLSTPRGRRAPQLTPKGCGVTTRPRQNRRLCTHSTPRLWPGSSRRNEQQLALPGAVPPGAACTLGWALTHPPSTRMLGRAATPPWRRSHGSRTPPTACTATPTATLRPGPVTACRVKHVYWMRDANRCIRYTDVKTVRVLYGMLWHVCWLWSLPVTVISSERCISGSTFHSDCILYETRKFVGLRTGA